MCSSRVGCERLPTGGNSGRTETHGGTPMTAQALSKVGSSPPPESDTVIAVRDLRMRYRSQDVLKGVGFTARRGEVLVLLGPNGAGEDDHDRGPGRLPDALGR